MSTQNAVPDPHERYLATRTFGSLDGLRALSILGVLWHHTMPATPGWLITERGFLGVDLFFVLSGFLITTLLLRERRRTGTISLRGFYVRRFLRIFPPYYAILAFLAVVLVISPGSGKVTRALHHDLPFAVFYVSNLVPMQGLLSITWSLSTEEQFYLVVPALQRWLPRALPWAILPAAYVLLSLPPFWILPDLPLPSFFRQTTFGPILLGVGLAQVLDTRRGFHWAHRLLGWSWAPLAGLGLLTLACFHPNPDISGWPRLFIHWAMALLLASCVVREDHALRPVLRAWPLRRVGMVSYGIYLYHLIVWSVVDRAVRWVGADSPWWMLVGVTFGSWGVAELSFRLYEARFLALKDRFTPARTPAPAPRPEVS